MSPVPSHAPHGSPAVPAVAVILVNWNGWRDTVECLDTLLAQQHPAYHIFVVDNASADGSVEHICDWCAAPRAEPQWRDHAGVGRHTASGAAPQACRVVDCPGQPLPPPAPDCRISLIRAGANLGFAGGCNVGLRAASPQDYDYFWLLNNDTVVQRDALPALLRRAGKERRIGMVGSTVRYYQDPDTVQAQGGARMDPARGMSQHIGQGLRLDQLDGDSAAVERDMLYVFGASMLVSRDFIREVGLLQEDYFLYFEEIDWALRGRDRFSLAYAADSHIFHKSGASSSKVMPLFTTRLFYRNRIRFISRFFPQHLAATRRRLAFDFAYYLTKGRWAHAGIVASVWWNARSLAQQALQQPAPHGLAGGI